MGMLQGWEDTKAVSQLTSKVVICCLEKGVHASHSIEATLRVLSTVVVCICSVAPGLKPSAVVGASGEIRCTEGTPAGIDLGKHVADLPNVGCLQANSKSMSVATESSVSIALTMLKSTVGQQPQQLDIGLDM